MQEDGVQFAFQVARIGEPLRVGRPGQPSGGAKPAAYAGVDFHRLAAGGIYIPEPQMLVAVGNALGVGRPARRVKEGRVRTQIDNSWRLQAILIAYMELILSGGVAEIGDGFAIG